MKLTPWFPEYVKPVRRGVYQTKYDGLDKPAPSYSYWDGLRWSNQTSMDNLRKPWFTAAIQEKRWRGLAEKP